MNRAERDERTQRIRIGLTGLAFVFLLVLLGTAISRSSEDPTAPPPQQNVQAGEPNEPLAEIGAAPGTTGSNSAASEQAPNPVQPE
ncbi:hypothetical protein [Sphingomonas edaphi]|jgi:hypothetical protein|uniref:Uncharacterized protein n=1 Tax=Sphingomonas edaphi TaxID=2315689 RepID=A0A418Q2P3_9SPHN|nr:hypothetical protein [Sphingomonas edaphi]RIX32117.1 hypothetical protein D3M59_03860 [Sphingomonas edaphi]